MCTGVRAPRRRSGADSCNGAFGGEQHKGCARSAGSNRCRQITKAGAGLISITIAGAELRRKEAAPMIRLQIIDARLYTLLGTSETTNDANDSGGGHHGLAMPPTIILFSLPSTNWSRPGVTLLTCSFGWRGAIIPTTLSCMAMTFITRTTPLELA